MQMRAKSGAEFSVISANRPSPAGFGGGPDPLCHDHGWFNTSPSSMAVEEVQMSRKFPRAVASENSAPRIRARMHEIGKMVCSIFSVIFVNCCIFFGILFLGSFYHKAIH